MKMIQDLGVCLLPNERVRRHYAIYECPYCRKVFTSRMDRVKMNPSMSCGCERLKHAGEKAYRHGLTHHPLRSVYWAMRHRCYNPLNGRFKDYGARGIIVCDEWKNSFKAFYDWSVAHGYKKGLQINRIDNNGNYCPENCEYTTVFVNNQNNSLLRSSNTSGYRGVTYKRCMDGRNWLSQIVSFKKSYNLGRFRTPQEAACAYNQFVITNKTRHPLNNIKG